MLIVQNALRRERNEDGGLSIDDGREPGGPALQRKRCVPRQGAMAEGLEDPGGIRMKWRQVKASQAWSSHYFLRWNPNPKERLSPSQHQKFQISQISDFRGWEIKANQAGSRLIKLNQGEKNILRENRMFNHHPSSKAPWRARQVYDKGKPRRAVLAGYGQLGRGERTVKDS